MPIYGFMSTRKLRSDAQAQIETPLVYCRTFEQNSTGVFFLTHVRMHAPGHAPDDSPLPSTATVAPRGQVRLWGQAAPVTAVAHSTLERLGHDHCVDELTRHGVRTV